MIISAVVFFACFVFRIFLRNSVETIFISGFFGIIFSIAMLGESVREKEKEFFCSKEHNREQAFKLMTLSKCLKEFGEYEEAELTAQKAKDYFESSKKYTPEKQHSSIWFSSASLIVSLLVFLFGFYRIK